MINPSEKIDLFGKDWQVIRNSSDARAVWNPGNLIQVTRLVNAYYFPYDIQEYYLEVFIRGYYSYEVTMNEYNDIIETSHGMWDVIGTSVKVTWTQATRARYIFQLQRKPQYVIINIILPILFLNILNVLVYMLPAESGESFSFSLTILLSIAVFMIIVSDILPRTSEPTPLIMYFLLASFIVNFLITLITVMNLRLFNKKEVVPIPNW